MAIIRRHIGILFVFILPVYFYIVQNTIQNKHTHVYANGVVVTHAHHVAGSEEVPLNEHDHSKSEICLYSALHLDLYDAPLSTVVLRELKAQHLEYITPDDRPYSSPVLLHSIPRGPPAKCFSI